MTKETIFTILIAISVFGFLILIHELGHFISARIFKVKINEFSIGMGPRLLYYDSKKSGTRYSLAIFPFGGFVAMEGEDGDREEYPDKKNKELTDAILAVESEQIPKKEEKPRESGSVRFDKKPAWQRLIITAAGATVNIVAGFLIMIIVTACSAMPSTTVGSFTNDKGVPFKDSLGYEVSVADSGIMVGDKIIAIDGKRVNIYDEMTYEIMRRGTEPVTVRVERNGDIQDIENVVFPTTETNGQKFGTIDFAPKEIKKNIFNVIGYSFENSVLIVRMVWESLFDLITGRYSLAAISGPIGISAEIGAAAKIGIIPLLYMVVIISINLGIMNLLPIPALDGGRIITILIEIITRKKIPARVERIINGVGLVLLLGLSLVVLVKDVIQLIM